MAWRLIETKDGAVSDDLTDGELIAIRVILAQYMGEPYDPGTNVCCRAYMKLEEAAEKALSNKE